MREETIAAILRLKERADAVGKEEEATMVINRVDGLAWLRKQIEAADRDLLAEMVKAVVEALMGAEADSLCGAPFGVSRSYTRKLCLRV